MTYEGLSLDVLLVRVVCQAGELVVTHRDSSGFLQEVNDVRGGSEDITSYGGLLARVLVLLLDGQVLGGLCLLNVGVDRVLVLLLILRVLNILI